MSTLNSPQKQAVEHLGSPLLVLAGAGSGKTRVITEKISWLIQNRAVSPADITAVTFTNKAAREMKERLQQRLGEAENLQGLTVSTFHSLGMKILRLHAKDLGLRSGFSIIDPRDVTTVLSETLRADPIHNKDLVNQVARRISGWKNLGLSVSEALQFAEDPIAQTAASAYKEYQRYLLACNSVDLDDLIFLPSQLFRDQPEICRSWQLRIRYLLVDEYQDTNAAQYQLVKQLAGDGKRLTVVGDDDQSIYAWRGAQPQNLAVLAEDFPNLTVTKLEQNYRSSARILKAANHVIANNPRHFDKSLWSDLGHGEVIRIIPADNEKLEAERAVSGIMRHQFKHRSSHGDFAILYRSNHQARELEIKLREMRIPYKISGGSSFFDRGEIRDVMAYLRLLTNPSDDTAFLRIINTPRRGIGASSLEKLAGLAGKRGQGMFHTLADPELHLILQSRQAKSLQAFGNEMGALSKRATDGDPIDCVNALLEAVEYQRWLHKSCETADADRRWENVRLLVDWLEAADRQATEDRTLPELVTELILNDALDQQKDEENVDQVNLMTLHAAKGLEFPHVFIVGVEENILPHKVSVEEGSDEEERRLFYVGITRAMRSLTLSYARRRKRFGDSVECEPSRFLQELPAEDVEWEDQLSLSPEQQQDTGRAHLASIRALRNRQ
ncbi:MAG: UvrD-helicase domain-containing protein [Acidiferrobacterales bacterium]|nr:UvrD-helicase domain-containing protein [Acidiferrobacterales bacterium]